MKATLEAIGSSASTVIVLTSLFSAILSLFLQNGFAKIVGVIKNLQIIVHILLIQVQLVPHAEFFLEQLAKIISFKVFDLSGILKKIFDVEESLSVDIRFESLGYQTSDSILNLGPIFAGIVLAPVCIILALILSQFCCFFQAKNFFKKQTDNIFFNGIIHFVEGTMLIIVVCCTINIY